ncbi:unnamed protein product [Chrysoparadoxa australica]
MRYSAGELLAAMSLMSSYSFSLAFLCHTPCSMSLEEPRSSAQTRRDVLITGLSALGASVVAPAFAGAAEEPKQGEGAMLLYDLYEDIKGDVTGKPKPEIVPKQGGYSPAEIAALEPAGSEKAYFAVGCYWGGEANFRSVPGVTSTRVGFMGGKQRNPDYEHIGDHLEVVEVVYTGGPTVYRNLLNVAARTYDFVDWGHRYERGIFTTSEDQYKLASASGEGWSGTPVVRTTQNIYFNVTVTHAVYPHLCVSAPTPISLFRPPHPQSPSLMLWQLLVFSCKPSLISSIIR